MSDPIYKTVIKPFQHEQLRKLEKENISGDTLRLKADVIIIGSGAGGAPAAAELARQGWNVLMLEEGSDYRSSHFNGNELDALNRLYREGGLLISEDNGITILQGRTIGGSTTINWQNSMYIEDHTAAEWDSKYGLKGYAEKDADSVIKEVHERIGVREVKPELINENNQVLLRGGKKLGLNPKRLKNNNGHKCIGLGLCGLGCPVNAKQSMFLTYLPDALAAGARIFANMRAVKITDGPVKKVRAEYTPEPLGPDHKKAIKFIEAEAKYVILSAGALEGPALLQRSGLGNDMVGKNLKIHPTVTMMARFKTKINSFLGPPESVAIEDFTNIDNSGYGFWLSSSPHRHTVASLMVQYKGQEYLDTMKNFPYLSDNIVLVKDGADGFTNGTVRWDGGRRKIDFALTPGDAKNLLLGIKKLAEVQVAAGALEINFPFTRMTKPYKVTGKDNFDWILKEKLGPSQIFLGTAHPHGSIQAASSPDKGAVDQNMQLYGHKGIYVMDASVFPTGLGVHPQITTMVTSIRMARRLGASLRG